jgi:hypothetical protein
MRSPIIHPLFATYTKSDICKAFTITFIYAFAFCNSTLTHQRLIALKERQR